jgi:hypothetical protein
MTFPIDGKSSNSIKFHGSKSPTRNLLEISSTNTASYIKTHIQSHKNMTEKTSQVTPIYPLVISHSYGKSPFIVDFPIEHGDFPYSYVSLPEGIL